MPSYYFIGKRDNGNLTIQLTINPSPPREGQRILLYDVTGDPTLDEYGHVEVVLSDKRVINFLEKMFFTRRDEESVTDVVTKYDALEKLMTVCATQCSTPRRKGSKPSKIIRSP